MSIKKFILFLGPTDEAFERVKSSLINEISENEISISFIVANEGKEAINKIENQKFDVIVIDADVQRLVECTFIDSLNNNRNAKKAEVIIIGSAEKFSLPNITTKQTLSKPFSNDDLLRALIKAVLGGQNMTPPKQNGFFVDVRVLNALIKATLFICQQFGLTKVDMQKPETKDPHTHWAGDVASYMAITSDLFKGALLVSFDKSVYLQILSNMLGEEQTEITSENADAIGEINNMILGNAKPDFTQYKISMTIPKILKKEELAPVPPNSVGMLIPFVLPIGKIYIEVIAHSTAS